MKKRPCSGRFLKPSWFLMALVQWDLGPITGTGLVIKPAVILSRGGYRR